MESQGDGETLSLEMPKNDTAKVQMGTVLESGVTGPSWGDSSASAGITGREPLRSVESLQFVPIC